MLSATCGLAQLGEPSGCSLPNGGLSALSSSQSERYARSTQRTAFERVDRRGDAGVRAFCGKEVAEKEGTKDRTTLRLSNAASGDRNLPARINRLVFELMPALPIPPWERPRLVYDDVVYNFAFGSNMKMEVLATRGGGIQVISAEPGKIEGYGLTFFAPTAASITPERGSIVHGILLGMPRKEYDILCKTEGMISGPFRPYTEEAVTVETYTGRKVQAVAFQMAPLFRIMAPTVPNKQYLRIIRESARESNLDAGYIEWLDSLPDRG